jgi:CRP/FNR family cyclic AMP-dependent transcriptional regulator
MGMATCGSDIERNAVMAALPPSPEVLDDALLREIAAQGGVRRFPARAILINEGDDSDSLFILLSGRVKVYSSNPDGKEIVIATHGPGEYVGELTLYGGLRSASVMTLEPTTCSVVNGANLRRFIDTHPDFAHHLVRKLIWRVRQATDSVKSLALQDVYERVVRFFYEASEDLDGPDGPDGQRVVRERLTQQQIAERVGSSREMVSRILKDLTAGGYVSMERGRVVLHRKPPAAW